MPRTSPALVLIIAVVLLTGCADDAAPSPVAGSAAPTWLVSGSAMPGVSASDEPPGAITCALLAAAIER
jgi:hypothetical protein